MTLRIALSSATALALMMGGVAWASDNNQAYIEQGGDFNSALITQGGSNNWAGYSKYKTYGSDPVRQEGDFNSLTINQAGSANEAGVSTYGGQYTGSGIDQTGNHNLLNIQQLTNGSLVHQVDQRASDGAASLTNSLSITQSSHVTNSNIRNRVNSVVQEHSGSAGANTATITQHTTGTTNGQKIGNGSEVSSASGLGVVQAGSGNSLISTQDGTGINRIVYMLQVGDINAISAAQTISNNVIGNNDDSVTDPQSGVQQIGDGNLASATQNGRRNTITYLLQFGDSNSGSLLQVGDDNISNSSQNGNDNITSAVQTGKFNVSDLDVVGNDNYLNLRQAGDFNVAAVSVDGSGNNSALPGMSPGFSGDALTVRNIVRADPLGAGFRRGDLFQEGSNNTLRGTTLGSPLTVTGDNNSFATYQNGTGNEIIGSINGNTNQAVVAQIGNGNTAAMNQIGNGNNLGISQ